MDRSTLLLNLAYLLLVSATLVRGVLPLRIALLGAATGFVCYGAVVGIWSIALWNTVIAAMHAWQVRRLLRSRRAVVLSEEEEQRWRDLAPGAERFDFFSLWQLGSDELRPGDELLTKQGEPVESLMMLLDGIVEIRIDGEVIDQRSSGSFIGELSLVSGEVASADTSTLGPVRLRTWRQSDLRALQELNPAAARLLDRMLNADLATKLREHRH